MRKKLKGRIQQNCHIVHSVHCELIYQLLENYSKTILFLYILTILVLAPWRRQLCHNIYEQIKSTIHNIQNGAFVGADRICNSTKLVWVHLVKYVRKECKQNICQNIELSTYVKLVTILNIRDVYCIKPGVCSCRPCNMYIYIWDLYLYFILILHKVPLHTHLVLYPTKTNWFLSSCTEEYTKKQASRHFFSTP